MSRSAMIESLEQRTLLAATPGNYVVSFYGLGGAGGFGNDWMDNISNKAAERTNSVSRRYNSGDVGRALRDLFRSMDTNHNQRIDKREVGETNLRVVGYSTGAVEAVNFARYLLKVGSTIKGFALGVGVSVRGLVALDPVTSPLTQTNGVPDNVYRFGNYYQQKGGSTSVSVYTQGPVSVKVRTITVDDSLDIHGETLVTNARRSRQIRIDSGPYQDETVKHEVQDGFDGKITGRNVNHGTVPFFAYDWAVEDMTV